MISTTDLDRIEGATAYDNDGDKIGKVDQVYLDDQTNEPNWVTITTGLFGTSKTFVPLQGASFSGDELRLPFDKEKVKGAPRVDADAHLDVNEEQELYRYYGLGDDYDRWQTESQTDTYRSGYDATYGTHDHDHDRTVGTGTTTGTVGDEAAVTLNEERLQVGTEAREAGRVRLRKYTTTETQNVSVPVTKEKLVVERNPVSGNVPAGTISDTDEVEEITLREERAVVDKETVAVEEVRVGKETVTETEQVQGTVRKEHADLDLDGEIDRTSAGYTETTETSTGTTGTTGRTGL